MANNTIDFERNTKYFTFAPLGWTGVVVFLLIGILCIIGEAVKPGLYCIVIAIVWGYYVLLSYKEWKTYTYHIIDDAVNSQLVSLKERALRKLGIDEDEVNEIAPIIFDGFDYDSYDYIKLGADNFYRTNTYKCFVFLFSANEVHLYTYSFNLTSDRQIERTDTFFYKDIVSVTTSTVGTSISVGNGESSQFDRESFELRTTGGNTLSCSVRNVDDAQRSIKGMRALLKEKKLA